MAHHNKLGRGIGLALVWLCLALAVTKAGANPEINLADSLHRHMLAPNGIEWRDFYLQSVIGQKAPFRLAEVESLLAYPEKAQVILNRLRKRWSAESKQPIPIDSLLACLKLENIRGSSSDSSLYSFHRSTQGSLQGKSKQPSNPLKRYAEALTVAEWAYLRKTVAQMFVIRPDDTLLDAVTQERNRLIEKDAMRQAFTLAQKLPLHELAEAARQMQALQLAMSDTLKTFAMRANAKPLTLRNTLRKMTLEAGLAWQEGSVKSENHVVSEGVFFDPGGDDTYTLRGDGRPGRILLLIDMAGDDVYASRSAEPALPGFGGIFSLHDLAGNDRYLDKGFGFGAGLFGISSVFDAEGDDIYEGGAATQGFGFFGVGLVQDQAGNDSYSASLFAQGASSTLGLGLLVDGDGNDHYLMRPVYVDDLRYRDHFLSMGQGFASGLMLGEAGGIGVLWDKAGHDTYTADIFAQGSGYWHALGLLLDDAGSDRYLAYQYAQGSGVHEAAGLLFDAAGDDRYFSKGVSQGCGHDRGLGLLFDASGHDLYLATDMSQGAGSANGLGILFDQQGDDAYQALKPERTTGHADLRRDRGSFGLFYDGGGLDTYPPGRKNGEAWRTYGQEGRGNGFGVDR